jgi:hypothetical protein
MGTVLNLMNGGQQAMNLATRERSPGKDSFQPNPELQTGVLTAEKQSSA